jgi:eukaryotic-like serine/threonine-protein kinase
MATDATDPTVNASGGPLAVGTIVAATYEVTDLLGQGGMGAVWAARHLRLPGKRVALKVLHGGGRDGDAYARFRREAEIASRIGHPNIVEISDFNTLPDGTPYLVLEYLEGESLGARLARGPLSPPAAMDILRQIGSALHAAHRAGIVHRDLKPENIFLCPTDAGGVIHDRVKVLDFGISKIKGSQTVVTQDAVLIGTPRYMAPEQALGRNQEIDARTDLFALGAIVYEMLAGRPPFDGDAVAGLIYAIVHEPHVPLGTLLPGLPGEVAAAVDKALAKRPSERFSDVATFVEAVTGRPLETLRGGASVGAAAAAAVVPPPGPSAAGNPRSTDPWAATAASVPGTAVAGGPTQAPAQPARAGRRAPLIVVAGLVLAGAVFTGLIARSRTHPAGWRDRTEPPAPSARATATEMKVGETSVPAKNTAPAGTAVVNPAAATPAVAAADPRSIKTKKADRRRNDSDAVHGGGAREREHVLSPSAEADVTEAEAALTRGDAIAAVRLAQHSLYAEKSTRAFAVMVKARCRQGDLGGARASLTHVTAPARGSVLRDCAAHGMDLR